MSRSRFPAALLALALVAPGFLAAPAAAVPVTLTLEEDRVPFRVSIIHIADSNPFTIGTNEFFTGGTGGPGIGSFKVAGQIQADLTGTTLTFLSGVLDVEDASGFPDITVTGGAISFPGLDPDAETDAFIGTMETAEYGTFHFFDNQSTLGDAAQTFDGTTAIIWGNNWTGPAPTGVPLWGIDFQMKIPEPGLSVLLVSALSLLGAAGLLARRGA